MLLLDGFSRSACCNLLVLLSLLEFEGLLIVPVHVSSYLLLDSLVDELEECLFVHSIVEEIGDVFIWVQPRPSLVSF